MEDFYYAGGLRGALNRLRDCLHTELHDGQRPDAGRRIWTARSSATTRSSRTRERPLGPGRGRRGAARQSRARTAPSSSTPPPSGGCCSMPGPAVVFRNYNDLAARIDDPALPVTADSVLVLQDAGPLGGAGHARVGHAADPEEAAGAGRARHGAHLRRADERHELRRLRAARRAGVVRRRPAGVRPGRRHHRARRPGAAPDAARTDEELARRRAEWKPREVAYPRGFGRLYARHVTQADRGCDFDFLEGTAPIAEPEIH